MSEHTQEQQDEPKRPTPQEVEREKGSPAQTGHKERGGMGTDEGSGWEPQGHRFGEDAGEGGAPRPDDDHPRQRPEQD